MTRSTQDLRTARALPGVSLGSVSLAAVGATLVMSLTSSATVAAATVRLPDSSEGNQTSSRTSTTVSYDLGVRDFEQPLDGDLARMPIRLWGSVSVPSGAGPFPVVVIAHGAHGDNCPAGEFDGDSWPCFEQERRSDLGMAHIGRAVARAGAIAIVPDLNAAYTGGWGEGARLERLRFRQVVETTLAELEAAGASSEASFADLDLAGRVDLTRLAVVGHSRGGYNSAAWARRSSSRPTSPYPASSLFLLAPFLKGKKLPDVPLTVAVGGCDGDTGDSGLGYLRVARSDPGRTAPTVTLLVDGANHNNYNRTLVADGIDDADPTALGCRRPQRARAGAQQRWARVVIVDHLASTFLAPRQVAPYLRGKWTQTTRIEGLRTRVERWRPES